MTPSLRRSPSTGAVDDDVGGGPASSDGLGRGQPTSTDPAGKRRPLPLSAAGEALLSFSLCNAEVDSSNGRFASWDFDAFLSRYLSPVVSALSPVMRLDIESQVWYQGCTLARVFQCSNRSEGS